MLGVDMLACVITHIYLCSEEADDANPARCNASTGQLAHKLQHGLTFCSVTGTAFVVLLSAPHFQETDRRQARQQGWSLLFCAAVNELAVVEQLVGDLADGWVTPAECSCVSK